jgi:hypothetical protein
VIYIIIQKVIFCFLFILIGSVKVFAKGFLEVLLEKYLKYIIIDSFFILFYLFFILENNLSFDPNPNTSYLQINQLKMTFTNTNNWYGSALNPEITNGIFKLFFFFNIYFYSIYLFNKK